MQQFPIQHDDKMLLPSEVKSWCHNYFYNYYYVLTNQVNSNTIMHIVKVPLAHEW